jgi:hypothetical protein
MAPGPPTPTPVGDVELATAGGSVTVYGQSIFTTRFSPALPQVCSSGSSEIGTDGPVIFGHDGCALGPPRFDAFNSARQDAARMLAVTLRSARVAACPCATERAHRGKSGSQCCGLAIT